MDAVAVNLDADTVECSEGVAAGAQTDLGRKYIHYHLAVVVMDTRVLKVVFEEVRFWCWRRKAGRHEKWWDWEWEWCRVEDEGVVRRSEREYEPFREFDCFSSRLFCDVESRS